MKGVFHLFALGVIGREADATGQPDALSLLQVGVHKHRQEPKDETWHGHVDYSGDCPGGKAELHPDGEECEAYGDVHLRSDNFWGEPMTPGIMPLATGCNGDVVQVYQCYIYGDPKIWEGGGGKYSGARASGMWFNPFNIRVVMTKADVAQVCIDELDGCQDLDYYVGDLGDQEDVYLQRWQSGVRVGRRSTGTRVDHRADNQMGEKIYLGVGLWMPEASYQNGTGYDACLGKMIGYPTLEWKEVDDPNTLHYERSIFTEQDLRGFCESCRWNTPTECKRPVPAPPPVTPPVLCAQTGVDYDKAVKCCEQVEGDSTIRQECVYDYCATGESEVCTEYVIIEGGGGRPICPNGNDDDCPTPPAKVCKNTAKLDLTNVVESRLHEGGKLRFGSAGNINGKEVDLIVTASPGYVPANPANTGNSGEFGVLNQKCGATTEFSFTIVRTGTETPEPIEMATLSYYDLDEGKRGKGRMTVETCDARETILAENTELSQVIAGDCVAVTSSKRGNAKDNPTSLMELDDIQRARAVTYEFEKLSSWKTKVTLAPCGAGGRGFMFSLRPAEACMPGADLEALGWEEGNNTVVVDRKECTLGGCPWKKGVKALSEACCMSEDMIMLKSWLRPNRKIRDTCLSLGNYWCTRGNKKQTFEMMKTHKKGGVDPNDPSSLKFQVKPADAAVAYLTTVGMFGSSRPRLQPAKRIPATTTPAPGGQDCKEMEGTAWNDRALAIHGCKSGVFCVAEARAQCFQNPRCDGFGFSGRWRGGGTYQLMSLAKGFNKNKDWTTHDCRVAKKQSRSIRCDPAGVEEAEWKMPFYPTKVEAQTACSDDPTCKGFWERTAAVKGGSWAVLVLGNRNWSDGTPNSVKKVFACVPEQPALAPGVLKCVKAACMEYGGPDRDCCSRAKDAGCGVGYTYHQGDYCYKPNDSFSTCCTKDGEPAYWPEPKAGECVESQAMGPGRMSPESHRTEVEAAAACMRHPDCNGMWKRISGEWRPLYDSTKNVPWSKGLHNDRPHNHVVSVKKCSKQ